MRHSVYDEKTKTATNIREQTNAGDKIIKTKKSFLTPGVSLVAGRWIRNGERLIQQQETDRLLSRLRR